MSPWPIFEINYGSNTKFMVGFKERLWRRKGQATPAARGDIVTDLTDQSYWETSKGQRGPSGIITNYLGGSRALDRRTSGDRLVSVLGELDKLYPGLKAAHDGRTALFDWGNYELNYGSYIAPSPGQYTTLWGAGEAPEDCAAVAEERVGRPDRDARSESGPEMPAEAYLLRNPDSGEERARTHRTVRDVRQRQSVLKPGAERG